VKIGRTIAQQIADAHPSLAIETAPLRLVPSLPFSFVQFSHDRASARSIDRFIHAAWIHYFIMNAHWTDAWLAGSIRKQAEFAESPLQSPTSRSQEQMNDPNASTNELVGQPMTLSYAH
jgi:hypothetical protein